MFGDQARLEAQANLAKALQMIPIKSRRTAKRKANAMDGKRINLAQRFKRVDGRGMTHVIFRVNFEPSRRRAAGQHLGDVLGAKTNARGVRHRIARENLGHRSLHSLSLIEGW
jgi:hypothetical protein